MEDRDARHPARRLRRLLTELSPELEPSHAGEPGVPGAEEVIGGAHGNTPQGRDAEPCGAGWDTVFEEEDAPGAGDRGARSQGVLRHVRARTLLAGAASVALVAAAAHVLTQGTRAAAPAPPVPRAAPSSPPAPAEAAYSAPSARLDASLAYDPATRTVLLYGGLVFRGNPQESALSDTWSWTGRRWNRERPRVSPPPLTGALLGYDPRSETLVLTGGETSDARGLVPNFTTWTWDGSTWSSDPAATLPPGDWPSALATDPASGQLVLVGTGPGCLGLETWAWSAGGSGGAGRWVALPAHVSPPPAAVYGLAYDPAIAGLDLFRGAGYCAGSTNTATAAVWSWRGGAWGSDPATVGTQLTGAWEMTTSSTGELLVTTHGTFLWTGGATGTWRGVASSPGQVGDAALAYDAATQQVVLFGGTCAACAGQPAAQTWILAAGGGWVAQGT